MCFIWQWWWAVVPIIINLVVMIPKEGSESTSVWVVQGCIGVVSGLAAPILIHQAFHGNVKTHRMIAILMASIALSVNFSNALEAVSRMAQNRSESDRILISQRELLSTRSTQLTDLATKLERQTQADPPEAIEALIRRLKLDYLYTRSSGCADATEGDSRQFCKQIESAEIRLSAARKLAEIEQERREIWRKLTSMESAPQAAEPGLEVMAGLTGLDLDSARTLQHGWIAAAIELLCAFMPAYMGTIRNRRKVHSPPERQPPVAAQPPAINPLVEEWATSRLRASRGDTARAKAIQEDFLSWCMACGHTPPKSWQTVLSDGMQAMGFRKAVKTYTFYQDVKFASTQLKVVK